MLHKTLNHLIVDRKIKKTEFSEYLGITRSTLNSYLSGKTPMPSDKIEQAADFFKVSISELFGEKKSKSSIDKLFLNQQKQLTQIKKQIQIIANSLQINFDEK